MNRAKRLFSGVRPWALPFYAITLVVGFLTYNVFTLSAKVVLALLIAVIGELFIHSATNVINDVYDFRRGIDDKEVASIRYHFAYDPEIGHLGAYRLSLTFLAVALALGLVVALLGRPLALLLGIIGAVMGYTYSGPPGLKYRALGDVPVMLATVLLTLTGYYIASGELALRGLLVGLPLALLIDDVLMANNIRDLERDGRAGVKTLVTVIGARAAKLLYFTFLSAAYVIEVALAVLRVLPLWSLLSLASASLLMGIVKEALREPSWKGMDVATANLATLFGLLEAVGLLVTVLA